jgi:hypothetical protein
MKAALFDPTVDRAGRHAQQRRSLSAGEQDFRGWHDPINSRAPRQLQGLIAACCGLTNVSRYATLSGMTTVVPEWDLADRMRKALRESNRSAGAMAEYLGVSRQTISSWLSGKYRPNKATLRVWADQTGVDFGWLCAARDSNPEPAD